MLADWTKKIDLGVGSTPSHQFVQYAGCLLNGGGFGSGIPRFYGVRRPGFGVDPVTFDMSGCLVAAELASGLVVYVGDGIPAGADHFGPRSRVGLTR